MDEGSGSSGASSASFCVRVRARRGGATAYARTHTVEIGAALPFDVEARGVTSLEYLLGAVGAEVVGGFRELARRRRLEIDDVEATVEATVAGVLAHLGVIGEEGPPWVERIAVRAHVATLEPEEEVRAVWEEALARAPLVRTLERALAVDVVMTVTA